MLFVQGEYRLFIYLHMLHVPLCRGSTGCSHTSTCYMYLCAGGVQVVHIPPHATCTFVQGEYRLFTYLHMLHVPLCRGSTGCSHTSTCYMYLCAGGVQVVHIPPHATCTFVQGEYRLFTYLHMLHVPLCRGSTGCSHTSTCYMYLCAGGVQVVHIPPHATCTFVQGEYRLFTYLHMLHVPLCNLTNIITCLHSYVLMKFHTCILFSHQ